MMTRDCTVCGGEVPADRTFCIECGGTPAPWEGERTEYIVKLAALGETPPAPLKAPALYWVMMTEEEARALAGRLRTLEVAAEIQPADGPDDLAMDVAGELTANPRFTAVLIAIVVATVAGFVWVSPWALAAGVAATFTTVGISGRLAMKKATVDAEWLLNATWGLDEDDVREIRMSLSTLPEDKAEELRRELAKR